jgi:hypothetical protein
MSLSPYEYLNYLQMLPNTTHSSYQLLRYVEHQHIAIKFDVEQCCSYRCIVSQLVGYYQTKIDIIKNWWKSVHIRRQYKWLTSYDYIFNFRLRFSSQSRRLRIVNGIFSNIPRKTANTHNLIDFTDFINLSSEISVFLRDRGILYGFDLRELQSNMNPYTNVQFGWLNQEIINDRVNMCQRELLEVDQIVLNIDHKITQLVSILEANAGSYINIHQVRLFDYDRLISILQIISGYTLINEYFQIDQNAINDREKAIDLMLHWAQYEDLHQSTRCLIISRSFLQLHQTIILPRDLISNDSLIILQSPLNQNSDFNENSLFPTDSMLIEPSSPVPTIRHYRTAQLRPAESTQSNEDLEDDIFRDIE